MNIKESQTRVFMEYDDVRIEDESELVCYDIQRMDMLMGLITENWFRWRLIEYGSSGDGSISDDAWIGIESSDCIWYKFDKGSLGLSH